MSNIDLKRRAAGKSAIWYTVSTFITKGLGFITVPLFTRLMTTGEFGLFNNFAAWQVILFSVFGLESYATLNRARLDIEEGELQNYQFTLLTSGMSFTALLAIMLVIVPAVPEVITGLDRQYLYAMVAYLFFYPAFNMFQTLQRVQYRYRLSASLSLLASLTATVLSVVLVVCLPDRLMGRILGQYAPLTILGLLFFFWYWKTGGRFDFRYVRYAFPLCVPLVVTVLGSQVLLLGCRIVTQHNCGANEVAYLSLATSLTQIVIILVNALNNAWSPWFYDCLEAKEIDRARGIFTLYIWATVALVAAVSLLAPELVLLLGGLSYLPSVSLIPSFMVTCLFSMLVNQYIYLETYHKDVSAAGAVTLAVSLANLLFCWLFIQVFGFDSIGYANLISNAVLVIAHYFMNRGRYGREVLSLRVTCLPLCAGLFIMPACLLLYSLDFSFIRYLVTVTLLLAAGLSVTRIIGSSRFRGAR